MNFVTILSAQCHLCWAKNSLRLQPAKWKKGIYIYVHTLLVRVDGGYKKASIFRPSKINWNSVRTHEQRRQARRKILTSKLFRKEIHDGTSTSFELHFGEATEQSEIRTNQKSLRIWSLALPDAMSVRRRADPDIYGRLTSSFTIVCLPARNTYGPSRSVSIASTTRRRAQGGATVGELNYINLATTRPAASYELFPAYTSDFVNDRKSCCLGFSHVERCKF